MKRRVTRFLFPAIKKIRNKVRVLLHTPAAGYQPGQFHFSRAKFTFRLLAIGFLAIIIRSFIIQTTPPSQQLLDRIADNQYQKTVELLPSRGNIYDSRGIPLAISVKTPSLAINPRLFKPDRSQKRKIKEILLLNEKKLTKLFKKKTYFAWLKRKAGNSSTERVLNLKIPGVRRVLEASRFYPGTTIASQLIGFVGMDNRGLSGLEKYYDADLRGQKETLRISVDGKGKIIFYDAAAASQKLAGNNITLTLDRALQEIAESALTKQMVESKAKSGFVIVSNPINGHILALANYPKFDPHNLNVKQIFQKSRNFALLDRFEPGSVIKPLIVAAALEAGKVSLTEIFDCENGSLAIGRSVIRDDHPLNFANVEEILTESSNICIYKIAKRLGKRRLFEILQSFGIADQGTQLGFPGEVPGQISRYDKWREIRFANISFGQGVAVKALELVQAIGAIANGGKLLKPILVKKLFNDQGHVVKEFETRTLRRVVQPHTAETVRGLMEKIVSDGTGRNAKPHGYTAAGKTGTAEKFDVRSKSYPANLRIPNFIGFVPAHDPQLVIYVVINEPTKRPFYGSSRAAPVFREVAEKSLRYLNIKEDDPVKLANDSSKKNRE